MLSPIALVLEGGDRYEIFTFCNKFGDAIAICETITHSLRGETAEILSHLKRHLQVKQNMYSIERQDDNVMEQVVYTFLLVLGPCN